jgi:hypothetical protein
LRTIRGGIRFGLDLWRLVPPKHRLLGYQRIVKSCVFKINFAVFAVPNIPVILVINLIFSAWGVSAKSGDDFRCSFAAGLRA